MEANAELDLSRSVNVLDEGLLLLIFAIRLVYSI